MTTYSVTSPSGELRGTYEVADEPIKTKVRTGRREARIVPKPLNMRGYYLDSHGSIRRKQIGN